MMAASGSYMYLPRSPIGASNLSLAALVISCVPVGVSNSADLLTSGLLRMPK